MPVVYWDNSNHRRVYTQRRGHTSGLVRNTGSRSNRRFLRRFQQLLLLLAALQNAGIWGMPPSPTQPQITPQNRTCLSLLLCTLPPLTKPMFCPRGKWQRPLAALIALIMVTCSYYPCCHCHRQRPQRHCHCLSTSWMAKLVPPTQRLMGTLPVSPSTPPILLAVQKQPWTPPQLQVVPALTLYPPTLYKLTSILQRSSTKLAVPTQLSTV